MTLTKPTAKKPSGKTKSAPPKTDAVGNASAPMPIPGPNDWERLQKKIAARQKKSPVSQLFGDDAIDGQIYHWGLSTLVGGPIDDLSAALIRIATDSVTRSLTDNELPPDTDLVAAAEMFVEASREDRCDLPTDIGCVLWASALPSMANALPVEVWWNLLGELQRRLAATIAAAATHSPHHLVLAGELGLTLAWRLADIPACAARIKPAASAVQAFLDHEDSIDEVLRQPDSLRAVMASVIRCDALMQTIAKRKLKKSQRASVEELATWIGAMCRVDGTSALSSLPKSEVALDHVSLISHASKKTKKSAKKKAKPTGKKKTVSQPIAPGGLMGRAMLYDRDTLLPAYAASLGQSQSGGRLAWEISLPESMWHSDVAGIAAMLPEWDVRRGRTFVDYSGESMRIEIMGGRRVMLHGNIETSIQLDGIAQHAKGPWQYTCEYTDDDVHYLELEQVFTGGVTLQRQFMMIRDDRCVMIADAVLPASPADETESMEGVSIRCETRLPIASSVSGSPDEQTRELYLHDEKRRAMVLPLAASEWRIGPTVCTADVDESNSEFSQLVITTNGVGAVYSPVWMDFQSRRFHRKRTWRTLTVADELQLVPRNVATGFRIQVGSEQWMLYRSLSGRRPRSVLGKHLVADFFAGRFHPGDGGVEELVTVDDNVDE